MVMTLEQHRPHLVNKLLSGVACHHLPDLADRISDEEVA